MGIELLAALGLALAAVWFVLQPILRPDTAVADTATGDAGAGNEEDVSPRAVALRALKEIEFDRATGKLAEGDYAALKTKYTAVALAALRAGDREPEAGSQAPAMPSGSGAPRSVPGSRSCPEHGPRPEGDAEFCSVCGSRLASAPGFCSRCGAALERDATFCGTCGVRVAA